MSFDRVICTIPGVLPGPINGVPFVLFEGGPAVVSDAEMDDWNIQNFLSIKGYALLDVDGAQAKREAAEKAAAEKAAEIDRINEAGKATDTDAKADAAKGTPIDPANVSDPAGPQPVLSAETKVYTDGTTATGTAPLPDQSPAQQDAAKADEKAETPAVDSPEVAAAKALLGSAPPAGKKGAAKSK